MMRGDVSSYFYLWLLVSIASAMVCGGTALWLDGRTIASAAGVSSVVVGFVILLALVGGL